MVAAFENDRRFTPAEYLAWEERQEFRHEYVSGQIYGMTGGTINHSKIAVNFSSALRNRLRGTGCQVLNSDAKVQIAEASSFFYPDISVTCDDRDRNASQFISYPCLIVEILSPTTEAYDRGNKFRLYRQSSSLQEYVLVNTTEIAVDVYRRNERGRWELFSYSEGEAVELESISLTLPIEQIYEDISFGVEL
jgi:Uma2 family endonuclease